MASSSSQPTDSRPVPAASNPVLLATQEQWLFTDEEFTRAPSQLDGMKLEQELLSRSKGVSFIMQVGLMLKLPQLSLATASVFLHRFFMRYSMVDLNGRQGMHPYPIAATALFLATKVEENVRRMRELVVACCRVAMKQPNMVVDEQSKEFWRWRDTILHHEDILLEALCFDLQLEHPYRILYEIICYFNMADNKPLRNAAWAFLNDSMFTTLCLLFSPRTIAAAALYAAAHHTGIGFPDDDLGRSWWEQVDVDIKEVHRACIKITQLYENNASQKHSNNYPVIPMGPNDSTEKTRIPYPGSPADGINGRKRSREPSERLEPPASRDQPSTLNGERSPKRQRTQDASFATEPSSSQERNTNGNHARQPRDGTEEVSEEGEIDPVQSRIDQIVEQNSNKPKTDRHNSSQRDDRDTQRPSLDEQKQRPDEQPPPPEESPKQKPEQNLPNKPPPTQPEEAEEGGGSEEGEL